MDIKVVLCSRIWIKSGHMFTYGSNLVICPKMDVNLVKGPKTCQLGGNMSKKDVEVVIAKKVCKSGNMSKERM